MALEHTLVELTSGCKVGLSATVCRVCNGSYRRDNKVWIGELGWLRGCSHWVGFWRAS